MPHLQRHWEDITPSLEPLRSHQLDGHAPGDMETITRASENGPRGSAGMNLARIDRSQWPVNPSKKKPKKLRPEWRSSLLVNTSGTWTTSASRLKSFGSSEAKRTPRVSPRKGLGQRLVEIGNEGQQPLFQLLGRGEARSLQQPPYQNREPKLDLVHP